MPIPMDTTVPTAPTPNHEMPLFWFTRLFGFFRPRPERPPVDPPAWRASAGERRLVPPADRLGGGRGGGGSGLSPLKYLLEN